MTKTLLITGGIGSGKSSVSTVLKELGYPVFDMDSAAKALYTPRRIRHMEKLLGLELLKADGTLDKAALAGAVFSDGSLLKKLEDYIYPVLKREFLRWRAAQGSELVFCESALALSKPLFAGLWDEVVLVDAPEEVRIRRAAGRDGSSEEEIRRRARSQEVPEGGDIVIDNSGTPEDLKSRVEALFSPGKNTYLCRLN